MNKSKKPNITKAGSALRRSFLAFAAFAALLPSALRAFQLQDIELASGSAQTTLKLTFSKSSPSEGEYPLYFQKADPARGTLTLSFLDTDSPFPLGRHAVEAANPAVEEILLKRVTSPSGKNFLGVELRLKEPPAGEAPVQPQPKGALKVMLGKGAVDAKGKPVKVAWSMTKAMKAREEYLTAKAEPAPAAPVPNKVEAQGGPEPTAPAASPTAPAMPSQESSAPAETSPAPEAAASAESRPATLKEIKFAVTRSQEDLSLVFEPSGSTPVHTAQTSSTDSSILEVTLDGVASGLPRKEYSLPGSGLFKKVRIAAKNGNLILRVHLVGKDPVHILPQEGGLTLTGGGKGEAAVPFKWTSAKPDAPGPVSADGGPDPVKSAHEDGESVDAAAGAVTGKPGKGKGLSSSRIFSLGNGGKSMILMKDSASLRAEPAPKGKAKKKMPLGERVERIDKEGAWIKVTSGADTGWVRASEAVYEDEMTEAQVAGLKKDIEALAAKAETARKKAEAAAAAAAAKEAEALAKAQAKADAKAAAQAQKESAAAEAAAQAATEAEPVRVAGPAAIPTSKAVPSEPANGRNAPDGPKLSLAETPELADKLAQEKKAAEEEKMKVKPPETRVAYNSYGRRDPFIPVEQGLSDNGIDIDQMKVVGIIWQAQEPMAVLEHNREAGVSFTVKQGDPVHNGRVSRITRDQVTFDISEYGISRSYSLKLVSNKEGKKQ